MRNSLQLASGGNVSGTADDYNPTLVQLPNNFLVLVFGSNRNGTHQIFVAQSATAYDRSGSLPKFNNPAAFTGTTSSTRIDFTAKVEGSDTRIYFNEATGISKALISNYTTPGSTKAAISNLANTNALGLKIRGIDDAGVKILSATSGGAYYSFDPDLTVAPLPLAYVTTGTAWTAPISLYDSGDNNGFFYIPAGNYTIGAATDTYDYGENYLFSDALDQSGLYISHMSILQNDTTSDPPKSRVILFSTTSNSAKTLGDLYVITSHSASDFWILNAILGYELADSSTPPDADHDYNFDLDLFDYGLGGYLATAQDLTGTGVTGGSITNFTHAGGGSALFTSPNANIGTFDLTYYSIGFSISVWIYAPPGPNYLLSNSATTSTTSNGFRFWRNGSNNIVFETGNGSLSGIVTSSTTVANNTPTHVVITADRIGGQGNIYINGALQGSGTIRTDFLTNATVCVGGGTSACTSTPLNGSMDELKIYEDYVLSAAEVTGLYNE